PGRAGPRGRLAQRGTDRARRPGCDAVRVQRLLGAPRVRLARARRQHRWVAPAGRHQPRIAAGHRLRVGRGPGGRGTDASRRGPLCGRPGGAPGDRHGDAREVELMDAERKRMENAGHPENGWHEASPWYEWGPYLAERAWGSVR